jgi:3-oxoacyl-[acyl-carrier-protein] synthase-3
VAPASVYVAGLAAWLPGERMPVADAVAAGLYDAEDASGDGYLSLSTEKNAFPPEMALSAARASLADARLAGSQLGMLAYTSIHRHGQPRIWPPASYLQSELDAPQSLPLTLQQGCNGAFIAIELARRGFGSDLDAPALIVAADRFEASGFNRWSADYGLVYGDAAVALTLSPTAGFAKVLHMGVASVPALERMHRHDVPAPETEHSHVDEYDIRATKRSFLQRHSRDAFMLPLLASLRRLRDELLAAHDLRGEPADWFVPPFVGNRIRMPTYEHVFAELASANAWCIGREIGHTGASDALLALWRLRHDGRLAPGQRVLMVSAGAGFSCAVALLQMQ